MSQELYKEEDLPKMLRDWLFNPIMAPVVWIDGERYFQITKEDLLEEVDWLLYNAYENPASGAAEYHHMQKKALKRFQQKLMES